jgi:multicomponent K+:H+ antiporter subunit G
MTGPLAPVLELLVSALLLVGGAFALVGSVGLVRLGDFYMRLHGPSKSTTLGVGAVLAGSALHFSLRGAAWSLSELLVTAFLFLTTPASAHLLAKAALHLRLENASGAPAMRRVRGRDETAAGSLVPVTSTTAELPAPAAPAASSAPAVEPGGGGS